MHLAAGRHENVCRCAALVRPFEDAVRDLLAPLPADPQGVDVENGGDLAQRCRRSPTAAMASSSGGPPRAS